MIPGDIVAIVLGCIAFAGAALIVLFVFAACRLSGQISEQEEREEAREDMLVECGGEAPPVVAYGRPQHIPEEVKARLREEWDKVEAS